MNGRALLALTAASLALPASAQDVPGDLTVMPPVPTDFAPPRTSWGDPDFRGTFPIDDIASIPFERLPEYENRFWLTDEEYAERQQQIAATEERSTSAAEASDRLGFAAFLSANTSGRRTSLLVSPPDGRVPELTPWAREKYEAGRSSWTDGVDFDWVSDFDTFDRCITRGFPATMMPHRYNNGIRVMQAPGYVVIKTEMVHEDRVIPVMARSEMEARRWPEDVRTWLGQSLGWWDGNTLVVETTNIRTGDSAEEDHLARGPSPLNLATHGREPWNTLPTSPEARVVERITMTGPDQLVYEVTYTDPQVFTRPWTARLDWSRDDTYKIFEYACHEGNVQIRDYITASRAERASAADGER
ncbi:hypothetical protein [Aurantiacibacter poecillastricola]|uniref:hypothetical protein n=1 Tax=Aurantiacibacter poecillastricola TaxID=3064385 RepID=UPI00273E1E10|nr:hypothetical protein [Aurantiacibacter sp. 219JJ12-13]MDP5262437.1 hypothetical protein [Aurantiacibacter sp. 219JJ12-13]